MPGAVKLGIGGFVLVLIIASIAGRLTGRQIGAGNVERQDAYRSTKTTVKITHTATDQPLEHEEILKANLAGIGQEMLATAKREIEASTLTDAVKNQSRNSSISVEIVQSGPRKLALYRIAMGDNRPIAIVVGPSERGVTEVYCSNDNGVDLVVSGGVCGSAIRDVFGEEIAG